MRLSWVIWVVPLSNGQTEERTEARRKPWEDQGREAGMCNHKSKNAIGHQELEKAGSGSPLQPPDEVWSYPHAGFCPGILISYVWPPEIRENKLLLLPKNTIT